MSSKLLPLGVAALFALTGCETTDPVSGSADPAFGEATKYNAAIQTIDPDPVYAETDAQPGDSGVKGAAAVKRYRTDTVKDVEKITTTSGSSGPQ
ncbi:MAG: hypothetical protein ABIP91_06740 [Sphingomicrobium sp.]